MTLIELMVTMTLSLIVLGAVLGTSQLFGSNTALNNKLTGAEDGLRQQVDVLVRGLRDAPPVNAAGAAGTVTPIAYAGAHDLIFRGQAAGSYVRYCLDNGTVAGTFVLRRGVMTGAYAYPGAACPAGASGAWHYGTIAPDIQNGATVFQYLCGAATATTCAAPGTVGTVTITITSRYSAGHVLTLTSSVTPRNRA
jgi:type II secretory pathway pseudopilin PulG